MFYFFFGKIQAMILKLGSFSVCIETQQTVNGTRLRTPALIYHETKAIFLSPGLSDNSSTSHIISPSTLPRSTTETVCLS